MDELSYCAACGTAIDAGDNFCRHCGASATSSQLPAIRRDAVPTLWRPQISPAVKGAAVMAAGTIGQYLFRRAVSNVLGGQNRSQAIRIRRPRERGDGLTDEAQIITETVMMRRVRIRRPE